MYKCSYCEKEFKSLGGCKGHEYSVHNQIKRSKVTCKFCGREFDQLGCYTHETHCSKNPTSQAFLKLQLNPPIDQDKDGSCTFCGKYCHNQNSLRNHERLCKVNPNHKESNLTEYSKQLKSNERTHWAKGQTVETNSSIARARDKCKITKQGKDYSGWHQTEDAKRRIGAASSKNLSEGYASGRISSPVGVGRGKYSYFTVNNKTYTLRSTWEFIYALYLATKGIPFEFEKIRVPAITPNKYSKTFISDFNYEDTVVEIKGIKSGKDQYIKEAFETAGYKFIELFKADIDNIKQELILDGYDVEELIKNIYRGHESKNYFRYVFN